MTYDVIPEVLGLAEGRGYAMPWGDGQSTAHPIPAGWYDECFWVGVNADGGGPIRTNRLTAVKNVNTSSIP